MVKNQFILVMSGGVNNPILLIEVAICNIKMNISINIVIICVLILNKSKIVLLSLVPTYSIKNKYNSLLALLNADLMLLINANQIKQ